MEIEKAFEEFWLEKPNRAGSNPKAQARVKFMRLVASGVDPQKIVGAAREWRRIETENHKIGTEYVAMATTWLNQKRYEDHKPRCASDYTWHDKVAAAHGWVWSHSESKYVRIA